MKMNKKGGMMSMYAGPFIGGLIVGMIALLAIIYFAKFDICSMLLPAAPVVP